MIKRIKKINFGIFSNFRPSADLQDFQRYNVVYGWNWSGKTTLSRIFRCFKLSSMHSDYPNGEFELELYDGTVITHATLSSLPNVRVFNKDFIDENISWDDDGAKPIYYFGKEYIDVKDKVDGLRVQREQKIEEKRKSESELEECQKLKEKIARDTAKQIKDILTTQRVDNYRTYDKTRFEDALIKFSAQLSAPQAYTLTDDDFQKKKESLVQEPKDKIIFLVSYADLTELIDRGNSALVETVAVQAIEKLTNDQELNSWVKDGLKIHKDKKTDTCEFCGNPLPKDLIQKLEKHFSDEYNNFIGKLTQLSNDLLKTKIECNFFDKEKLYKEFQSQYENQKLKCQNSVDKWNQLLTSLDEAIKSKKENPFKTVSKINTDWQSIRKVGLEEDSALKLIIDGHNKKTDDFEQNIDKTKEVIEIHYLCSVANEIKVLDEKIKQLTPKIDTLTKEFVEIESQQKELDARIADHGIPAQTINEFLKSYFGRDEIQLEVHDNGYYIKRHEEIAKNLSEGEKTAVAFVYFVAKLKEKNFNLSEGIVVIDDPVSSLDSNALFQAFSFMKNSTQGVKQLFILTHNFDFFRQVKDWFKNIDRNHWKKYCFMLKNELDSTKRIAKISSLDRLLLDYESEYHYLFSLLYRYSIKNETDLEKIYPMPNIARKYLESFLAFKLPDGASLHTKLNKLTYDTTKRDKIRRFVETHSHPRYFEGLTNFDESLLAETGQVVKDLLDLVSSEDKRHYETLVETVSTN